MSYVKKDTKGSYIEAMNGNKLYLKGAVPFKPIDYSQPKATRPGIAETNPFQKALATAIKNIMT